ncbi:MAG: hypothetical protein CMP10_06045 [Zetaproteobacteria bacterium]|nr:hypothetical protein [Pseudobdellovibrionaceae bacterium]
MPTGEAVSMVKQIMITQNLRASHKILTKLERSKNNVERMIDRLPDIFGIIEMDGRILKGNKSLADWYHLDNVERILGHQICDLFCKQSWSIFQQHLGNLVKNESNSVDFELQIDCNSNDIRSVHWNIQRIDTISRRRGDLFIIFGRDITQIRHYEKQLSQIFSAIPLGIFTMDPEGMIDGPHSFYLEYLLGQSNLSEKSMKKVIFEKAEPLMSQSQVAGYKELFGVFGMDEFWFDMGMARYPAEIFLPTGEDDDKGLWLGFSYHAILRDALVHRVLVVVEDRTQIVKERMEASKKEHNDNITINRILDIQNCDPVTLKSCIADLNGYFHRFEECWAVGDSDSVVKTLHGIKGVSRSTGLRRLMNLCHHLEDYMLGKVVCEDGDIERSRKSMLSEWHEIHHMYRVFSELDKEPDEPMINPASNTWVPSNQKRALKTLRKIKSKAKTKALKEEVSILERQLKQINYVPVRSIVNQLKHHVESTEDMLDKSVNLEIDLEDVLLSEGTLSRVRECLWHLVTNALDHGFETAAERKVVGKNPIGTLRVCCYVKGAQTFFEVEDDGHGFNFQKIAGRALERKLTTPKKLKAMSNKDILEFLFSSGFSTSNEVTVVSGRGLGLDAVRDITKQLGGKPVMAMNKKVGTMFRFSVK